VILLANWSRVEDGGATQGVFLAKLLERPNTSSFGSGGFEATDPVGSGGGKTWGGHLSIDQQRGKVQSPRLGFEQGRQRSKELQGREKSVLTVPDVFRGDRRKEKVPGKGVGQGVHIPGWEVSRRGLGGGKSGKKKPGDLGAGPRTALLEDLECSQ